MWVVKLGGSLLGSPELKQWLDTLVTHSDGRVLIVPGGSLFADAVREAQAVSGVDDVLAHRLALLAMDQYGWLLTGLCPQLAVASTELEIAERGWQHRAIVWLPSHMALADERIPASWSVTSDSLAAWLAQTVAAERLILVKSVACGEGAMPADQLSADGVLDSSFREFSSQLSCPIHVVHKGAHRAFVAALSQGGDMPGVLVT